MNYTPTPMTDAFAKSIDQSNFEDSWKDDFEEFAWVTADFARILETELAAVTEQLKDANERITELKSDRSILTQDGERWREIAIRMQHQRDTLAEALRKAISWGDSASHHILYRQNINWTYLNEAREALQSLNQPTP